MVTAIFTDIYLTRAIKVDSFYFALYISLFVGVGLILLIWLLIQDKPRLLEENDWGIAVFRLSAIRQLLIEKKIIKNQQMWFTGAALAHYFICLPLCF